MYFEVSGVSKHKLGVTAVGRLVISRLLNFAAGLERVYDPFVFPVLGTKESIKKGKTNFAIQLAVYIYQKYIQCRFICLFVLHSEISDRFLENGGNRYGSAPVYNKLDLRVIPQPQFIAQFTMFRDMSCIHPGLHEVDFLLSWCMVQFHKVFTLPTVGIGILPSGCILRSDLVNLNWKFQSSGQDAKKNKKIIDLKTALIKI